MDEPQPLQYEETPEITPVNEPQTQPASPPPVPKKFFSFGGFIKNIIFFVILFAIGFSLSGVVRDWMSNQSTASVSPTPKVTPAVKIEEESTQTAALVYPTPTPTPKTYSVLNGLTRKPVEDITFLLPSAVLPLICDGSACGSQGTYLPGGTRFTVAARGEGQVLADFRGKIISDAGGKQFTASQTTAAGKPATEFTSNQMGSTIGGYAFSRMRGYMIAVTDRLSLEINHFSPSGITTDFEADDLVFENIVRSLAFGAENKGAMMPIPTAIVTPTATVTPTIEPFTPIR